MEEKWIEIYGKTVEIGFPNYEYVHNSCQGKVERVYPYCPWCGKEISHVKFLDDDLKELKIKSSICCTGFIRE